MFGVCHILLGKQLAVQTDYVMVNIAILMTFVVAVLPTYILSDLCDPLSVPYTIGQNVRLLDISSEEISQLPTTCTKEIQFKDAVYSSIHVDEASFSGNEGFEYSVMGTISKVFTDSAALTNRCSNHAGGPAVWSQPVVRGLTMYRNTDYVCVRFKPELNHRSLGYHVKGGRLRITLQVRFAYCSSSGNSENDSQNNTNDGEKDGNTNNSSNNNNCRPICSATGVESTCESSTTEHTSKPFKSTIPATSFVAPVSRETLTPLPRTWISSSVSVTPPSSVLATMSFTVTTPMAELSQHTTNGVRTSLTSLIYVPNSVSLIGSSPKTTTTYQTDHLTRKRPDGRVSTTEYNSVQTSGITGSSRTPAVPFEPRRNVSGNVNKNTVSPSSTLQENQTYSHPSISPVFTTTRAHMDISSHPNGSLPLLYVTTDGLQNNTGLNVKPSKTVQMHVGDTSAKTFGLLEGLYVLVGCLVIFVLIGTLTYCIRKTRKSKTSVSPPRNPLGLQTLSTSSYMSQWRDNWLVRYHNNANNDSETNSISEIGVDIIHEQLEHKSNEVLKSKHGDPGFDEDAEKVDEQRTPWALIRLDSDFVKNTKSLNSLPSNETIDTEEDSKAKPKLKLKISKASSDSGIGRSESMVCDTITDKKASSLKERSELKNKRFRYIKRMNSHVRARGSYNVSKATRRSASLSSYDTIGRVLTDTNKMICNQSTDALNSRGPIYNVIPELHALTHLQDEEIVNNEYRKSTEKGHQKSLYSDINQTHGDIEQRKDHESTDNNYCQVNNADGYSCVSHTNSGSDGFLGHHFGVVGTMQFPK